MDLQWTSLDVQHNAGEGNTEISSKTPAEVLVQWLAQTCACWADRAAAYICTAHLSQALCHAGKEFPGVEAQVAVLVAGCKGLRTSCHFCFINCSVRVGSWHCTASRTDSSFSVPLASNNITTA